MRNIRFASLLDHSVARAFAISLLAHGFLFGALELGYRLGLWERTRLISAWLEKNRKPDAQTRADLKKNPSPQDRDLPIIFVEVDPLQEVEQAPPKAKYYSYRNSQAANVETKLDLQAPKISGVQDKVPGTLNNPRSAAMPLQPEIFEKPPAQEPKPAEPSEPEPEKSRAPGNLALARPSTAQPKIEEAPRPDPPPPKPVRDRPRTLAALQQNQTSTPGEKMKQEGGVRRYAFAEGLDVQKTPFGTYDAAIIAAIRQRWYDLLDERETSRSHTGKVVLTFRLNSNGSISDMRVVDNEVGEILALICQRAVQDPAPYARWPDDMRRLVGGDYREVRFTFYHN